MSHVTQVMLTFAITEEKEGGWDSDTPYVVMRAINTWLVDEGHAPFKGRVDAEAGGEKCLEVPIYVAAFNYLDVDACAAMLAGLPWREPRQVQLWICDQDDERFHELAIKERP